MVVYAIQAGSGGPFKFGITSKTARHRLNQLQNSHYLKLRLIAEIPGDEAMERLIHEHLARHKIRGEWYRATVPVLEMVRLMREGDNKALQAIALKIAEDYRSWNRSARTSTLSVKNALNRLNSPAERYVQAS